MNRGALYTMQGGGCRGMGVEGSSMILHLSSYLPNQYAIL